VEIRPVKVASIEGDKTVIGQGVASGDTVVVDGQLTLFPGAKVRFVDASKLDSAP
jgi:multidrug efflux pump subunit AcrA (membrane-fusion protein)